MNNHEMTPEREELMEKFDEMLPSDDSVQAISDGEAICLDALSDEELKLMMEQHEENKKFLAKRNKN